MFDLDFVVFLPLKAAGAHLYMLTNLETSTYVDLTAPPAGRGTGLPSRHSAVSFQSVGSMCASDLENMRSGRFPASFQHCGILQPLAACASKSGEPGRGWPHSGC